MAISFLFVDFSDSTAIIMCFWGLQSLCTLHKSQRHFLKMKFRCALNEFVNADFVKINQALV